MIAKLIDPYMDKNFSLQFFKVTKIDKRNIYTVFHSSCEKFNHQFMQGDYEDWMMIEFWTDDIDLIIRICEYYKFCLKIQIEGL